MSEDTGGPLRGGTPYIVGQSGPEVFVPESRGTIEPQLIHREFDAELAPSGDGRTLDLRVVPYNIVATVSDPPDFEPYQEMWLPRVFERQMNAANRLLVNFEHEGGISGVVGRGLEYRDGDAALEASVRMLTAQDADKALELVNEGVLNGVSLEARAIKSVREGGIVKRVKAHLINIALCRSPAFKEAQVLAVRTQQDIAEEFVVPPNPELAERLERLGFEPLHKRAVVRGPWSGDASRFEDDEYQRACLVCRPGDEPPKSRCSLPVLEPNGDLNVNGMHAAAGRLNQTSLSPELKAKAARKLIRYYRQAGEEPPPALVAMAGR